MSQASVSNGIKRIKETGVDGNGRVSNMVDQEFLLIAMIVFCPARPLTKPAPKLKEEWEKIGFKCQHDSASSSNCKFNWAKLYQTS